MTDFQGVKSLASLGRESSGPMEDKVKKTCTHVKRSRVWIFVGMESREARRSGKGSVYEVRVGEMYRTAPGDILQPMALRSGRHPYQSVTGTWLASVQRKC